MSKAGPWTTDMERVTSSLGDQDIRVDPWQRSSDGRWSTRFDTFVGDWVVSGKAELGHNGLQITQLAIDFNPLTKLDVNNLPPPGSIPARLSPSAGITNDVVRHIPLARIRDAAQRMALTQKEFDRLFSALGPDNQVPKKRRRSNRKLAVTASQKGTIAKGRPSYASEHWKTVALTALRLQQEGSRPLRAEMAKEFGVSEYTIRDWVNRSRREGFLAPTTGGQRGVHPGPRL